MIWDVTSKDYDMLKAQMMVGIFCNKFYLRYVHWFFQTLHGL